MNRAVARIPPFTSGSVTVRKARNWLMPCTIAAPSSSAGTSSMQSSPRRRCSAKRARSGLFANMPSIEMMAMGAAASGTAGFGIAEVTTGVGAFATARCRAIQPATFAAGFASGAAGFASGAGVAAGAGAGTGPAFGA